MCIRDRRHALACPGVVVHDPKAGVEADRVAGEDGFGFEQGKNVIEESVHGALSLAVGARAGKDAAPALEGGPVRRYPRSVLGCETRRSLGPPCPGGEVERSRARFELAGVLGGLGALDRFGQLRCV